MCQKSFEKVGRALRDMVDSHGGSLIISRQEVVEYLEGENLAAQASAIEHYPLALWRQGLATAPYHSDGSVVILFDATKFRGSSSASCKRGIIVTPEASLQLNELAFAG